MASVPISLNLKLRVSVKRDLTNGKLSRPLWYMSQYNMIRPRRFVLYLGGVFNKTIIPLALAGYEMIIANSALCTSCQEN